jgi:pyruvate formate lyase activating enzyme
MSEEANKGKIINIQRYSVHDGPGIRSTVFMKGCPLSCRWCSNPESQATQDEVIHRNSLCERCGRCKEACETDSIFLMDDGIHINRESCTNCDKCVEACCTGTLNMVGSMMSVEEIVEVLKKDSLFYRNSEGGITVGGGEPLMQAEFVSELLEACQRQGWHTVLDTCGYAGPDKLKMVLEYVDLVYYDLKHMDPEKHKEVTGVSNDLILKNVKLISDLEIPFVIRVPVIPGINDDEDNIRKTAEFVSTLKGVQQVNLLPYHLGGLGKHNNLDRDYPMGDVPALIDEDLLGAKKIIESKGLKAVIGG